MAELHGFRAYRSAWERDPRADVSHRVARELHRQKRALEAEMASLSAALAASPGGRPPPDFVLRNFSALNGAFGDTFLCGASESPRDRYERLTGALFSRERVQCT